MARALKLLILAGTLIFPISGQCPGIRKDGSKGVLRFSQTMTENCKWNLPNVSNHSLFIHVRGVWMRGTTGGCSGFMILPEVGRFCQWHDAGNACFVYVNPLSRCDFQKLPRNLTIADADCTKTTWIYGGAMPRDFTMMSLYVSDKSVDIEYKILECPIESTTNAPTKKLASITTKRPQTTSNQMNLLPVIIVLAVLLIVCLLVILWMSLRHRKPASVKVGTYNETKHDGHKIRETEEIRVQTTAENGAAVEGYKHYAEIGGSGGASSLSDGSQGIDHVHYTRQTANSSGTGDVYAVVNKPKK